MNKFILLVLLSLVSLAKAEAQIFPAGSTSSLLGVTRSIAMNTAAPFDTAIALTSPDGSTYVVTVFSGTNCSGTPTNHTSTIQTASAGGGTNLGSFNLSSVATGLSRSFLTLANAPTVGTGGATVYMRTTVASTPAVTCDVFVWGQKLT